MILTVTAAVILGVTSGAAQSDLVKERVDLMAEQGKAMGALTKIARGEVPYDQATVDQAFAALKESASELPDLFPPTAKGEDPDSDYYASEKVWENKADFDARLKKLITEIDANAPKAKDVESLKAARGAVGKVCGDCHETYRVKKS
ncbi:MAG: cytochrome c [Xanthobacteraceae bacterium]